MESAVLEMERGQQERMNWDDLSEKGTCVLRPEWRQRAIYFKMRGEPSESTGRPQMVSQKSRVQALPSR